MIVRGLTNGDFQADNLRTVVISEIWVRILNGLIFGLLCEFIIANISGPILGTSFILGLTVGIGIVLAVAMSAIMGSTTPIIFIRLNIDLALSAGPSITVANDIIGLLIYLVSTSFI